jgi:hypothetical protein
LWSKLWERAPCQLRRERGGEEKRRNALEAVETGRTAGVRGGGDTGVEPAAGGPGVGALLADAELEAGGRDCEREGKSQLRIGTRGKREKLTPPRDTTASRDLDGGEGRAASPAVSRRSPTDGTGKGRKVSLNQRREKKEKSSRAKPEPVSASVVRGAAVAVVIDLKRGGRKASV